MNIDFRMAIAKVLGILALVLVAGIGLITGVPLEVLALRALLGGVIFAIIGFLAGHVIEQQREEVEEEENENSRENTKLSVETAMPQNKTENTELNNNENATPKGSHGPEDFSPLDIENLSKIVVEALNE